MPHIHLETFINAPVEIVFGLSRSVDLHTASMTHHREEIIDGVRNGLLNKGDTVTWKAAHLFRNRTLKVQVTELAAPTFFADEMREGDFKMVRHEHLFKSVTDGTVMTDEFYFETPFGLFGALINRIYLKTYLTKLLQSRNAFIKQVAESSLWKQITGQDAKGGIGN